MSFYSIAAKCNRPSEAAHDHIDDDRYGVVKLCAVGKLRFDLSDQLRATNIRNPSAQ